MKFSIKNIAFTAAFCACAMSVAAQSNTGYFSEGYIYNYQLNPALANDRGFVAFPGIGNINFGIGTNMNIGHFLYNVDGRTTTFMNPKVSTEQFLKDLPSKMRLAENARIGILGFGFKAFKGYNTLSISLVQDANLNLPCTFFELAKEGLSNKTYSIRDVAANANAYVEVALGHSRQITKDLRVGATLKILASGAHADIFADKADIALGVDSWQVTTNARARVSAPFFNFTHSYNSNTHHEYVGGVDIGGDFKDQDIPMGYGAAIDLGAVYKFRKDFEFSIALTDLGFINYKRTLEASTNGDQTINLDNYRFSTDDNAPNSFDNEFDRLGDDFAALYELNDNGDIGSTNVMLGTTLRVGALYKLPIYRKLSFGLLSTTRIQSRYSWTEARLSVNIAPIKVFSLNLAASTGTFGTDMGFMFNLHCPGFGLFLAMDHIPFKFTKQYIPMSSMANLSFGLNIPIK